MQARDEVLREKAGKRAKCPKCDAIVLIKADADSKNGAAAAAPPAEPAQSKPPEVEEVGEYGVAIDPELEELARKRQAEEDAKAKAKKERKKLPKVGRMVKAIPDAESWKKVLIGMLFVFAGTWVWLFCHVLQGSYVLPAARSICPNSPTWWPTISSNARTRDFQAFEEGWQDHRSARDVFRAWVSGRTFSATPRAV